MKKSSVLFFFFCVCVYFFEQDSFLSLNDMTRRAKNAWLNKRYFIHRGK